MEISERIQRYKDWNDAFYNYFFGKNDENEVFLYITRDVVDQIGKNANLGDCDQFFETVLIPVNDRSLFSYELYHLYLGIQQPELKATNNLFGFAQRIFINNRLSKKFSPCPFLNYLVLSILIVSQGQQERRKDIGMYLTHFLQERIIKERGSRAGLDELFAKLNELQPSFRNYNLTANQRYVGLIKYQLIVSGAQIQNIENAMIQNSLNFTEDDSYENAVYKLYDYVDEDVKRILIKSLEEGPGAYRKRLENIIFNFDPENIVRQNEINIGPIRGTFAHAMYFGKGDLKVVLLTDVKKQCILQKNRNCVLSIPQIDYDTDLLGSYNPGHIIVNNSDRILIGDYSVHNEDYHISQLRNDGIIFFQKYNDEYYIETHNLENRDTYIAVQNGSVNPWNKYVRRSSLDYREIHNDFAKQKLFGNEFNHWHLYRANRFSRPFYQDKINDRIIINNVQSRIQKKGGIIPKGKKNVYLINALPYFEFPVNIERNLLKVYINIDNELQQEDNEYKIYIVDQNKLIIDITRNNILGNTSSLDIAIEYHSADFQEDVHESFYISGQDINYNEENLYRYDKWGDLIKDNEDITSYTRGVKIVNARNEQNRLNGQGPRNLRNQLTPLSSSDGSRFFFINMLAAVCFSSENSEISKKMFDKCIRYAATRNNIDYKETDFQKKSRYFVIDSYYVNGNQSRDKFQAIPPSFFLIPKSIGQNAMWILCGCYTKKFLIELISYCHQNGIGIYEKSEVDSSNQVKQIMPPRILLEHNFNPEQFIRRTGISCEYKQEDLSLDLLSFIASVSNYEATLSRFSGIFNASLKETDDSNFPRMRESIGNVYNKSRWIESSLKQYWEPTISDWGWMQIYCYYKLRTPICYYDDSDIVYFQNDILLPGLLRRICNLVNLGEPIEDKFFICNNSYNRNQIYTKVKGYNLGVDKFRKQKIAQIISGNTTIPNDMVLYLGRQKFYTLEIWNKKKNTDLIESYGKNDQYYILKNCDYGIVSFSKCTKALRDNKHELYIELYILDNNIFRQIGLKQAKTITNGDIHRLFSFIIGNYDKRSFWKKFGNEYTMNMNSTANLPLRENYNIENITIKQNRNGKI